MLNLNLRLNLLLLLLMLMLVLMIVATCMGDQLILILEENFRLHVKAKINPKEKLHLETVHFGHQNSSNLGIIRVVVVGVVEELRGQEDGGDYDAVNIELGQNKIIVLDETVDVDEGKDEALC